MIVPLALRQIMDVGLTIWPAPLLEAANVRDPSGCLLRAD
jgi:hypothetical protein